jgi:hypothetical protein
MYLFVFQQVKNVSYLLFSRFKSKLFILILIMLFWFFSRFEVLFQGYNDHLYYVLNIFGENLSKNL